MKIKKKKKNKFECEPRRDAHTDREYNYVSDKKKSNELKQKLETDVGLSIMKNYQMSFRES